MVVDLLNVKWKSFVRREFFTKMFLYLIFFGIASVAFVLRPTAPDQCNGEEEDGLNATTRAEEVDAPTNTLDNLTQQFPSVSLGVNLANSSMVRIIV